MEHLLSGAAAVEEKSKSGDTDAVPTTVSGNTNNTPPLVDTKSESAERTPSPPLPKLPPISTLTHLCGLPPSLQPPVQATATPTNTAVASAAPRQTPNSLATHDEGLCRYRNKLCLHPRALKRNGELHNLCEKHRAKANQNQRKLESKRRVQKRQTRQVVPHVAAPRAYQLTPAGAAPVMTATAMHMHPQYQYQQQPHQFHLQAPPSAMRSPPGALPSLAQLHRAPPPPPSSSSPSSRPAYPYHDGHNYPPYSR